MVPVRYTGVIFQEASPLLTAQKTYAMRKYVVEMPVNGKGTTRKAAICLNPADGF